jgi:hypothetical protein
MAFILHHCVTVDAGGIVGMDGPIELGRVHMAPALRAAAFVTVDTRFHFIGASGSCQQQAGCQYDRKQ